MNSMPPQDPSEPAAPSAPPGPPHMAPPPPGPPQFAPPPPLRPPSDAPSPIGLGVAGVGLALLCVSLLLPRIKIDDPDGEFSFYSLSGVYSTGSGFGIDTPTVVLAIALLAAVGLSTLRRPALRWPVRLGAVGAAALFAAVAYHPVTQLRQAVEYFQGYDEFDGSESASAQIDITADSGVYLLAVGVALLALSTFFMHVRSQGQYVAPPPPAPAGWPGAEPTITVSPG
ncbi:hypothetical protein [Glycomyces amatae]|uniref:hypothetical protein n=1 Tax=Glycomyces amatae TaxID=2881355 RepID=UPI002729D93A|nr:hypothetical protein [Glycomyces amatae]